MEDIYLILEQIQNAPTISGNAEHGYVKYTNDSLIASAYLEKGARIFSFPEMREINKAVILLTYKERLDEEVEECHCDECDESSEPNNKRGR